MKLKQKKILIIIMFLIIVILFVIIFKDFFGKTVYANTENSNIRFSNAMNIDIEEIVKQNSKINLELIDLDQLDNNEVKKISLWACSAVGSAPHSHCGGRRFESDQVH